MSIPQGRPPSEAEEAGWRRFWDGWIICPACIPAALRLRGKDEWPVPATYDTAIKQTDTCDTCKRTPADGPVSGKEAGLIILDDMDEPDNAGWRRDDRPGWSWVGALLFLVILGCAAIAIWAGPR